MTTDRHTPVIGDSSPRCRLCGTSLVHTFVDLGMSPPCESFLAEDQLDRAEVTYPLHVRICARCLLVQLPAYITAQDTFSDYAYFSSYSTSWVEHARRYAVDMGDRLGLGAHSLVTEVASNDGYLLQHFVARDIPVLGIEPAQNIAEVARDKGVRTENVFLSEATGRTLRDQYGPADLVVGNNVYAHVPDLTDFTKGLRALVGDRGIVTLEVPHLLRLIDRRQYDTIYHEHFQYYTVLTASRALASGGLRLVDVDQLPSHGGSLRLYAQPEESARATSESVTQLLAEEGAAGLHTIEGHAGFASSVDAVKRDLLEFLIDAARAGKTVAGYGAPGKGNTLLNHCGIRSDLLAYTVDRNPYKQGRYSPGTHIPIFAPEQLAKTRPDYILILPWNLRSEIAEQLDYTREWGARLVTAIPELIIDSGAKR